MPGNYTRTLVGPLTANAAKLLDDKKEQGIFFTFQDLSVRTEGTSRDGTRALTPLYSSRFRATGVVT